MEPQAISKSTVTELSTYRGLLSDRQKAIAERIREVSERPAHTFPTAVIAFSVLRNGKVQATTLQIEPEHVMPMLSAMRSVAEQLELYLNRAIKS